MSELLRSTFQLLSSVSDQESLQDMRNEFRKRALESISGSMVFVEDAILYWDFSDE